MSRLSRPAALLALGLCACDQEEDAVPPDLDALKAAAAACADLSTIGRATEPHGEVSFRHVFELAEGAEGPDTTVTEEDRGLALWEGKQVWEVLTIVESYSPNGSLDYVSESTDYHQCTPDGLRLVYSGLSSRQRIGSTYEWTEVTRDRTFERGALYVPMDLTPGTTWQVRDTWTDVDGDGVETSGSVDETRTVLDAEDVEVPAGVFSGLQVSVSGESEDYTTDFSLEYGTLIKPNGMVLDTFESFVE